MAYPQTYLSSQGSGEKQRFSGGALPKVSSLNFHGGINNNVNNIYGNQRLEHFNHNADTDPNIDDNIFDKQVSWANRRPESARVKPWEALFVHAPSSTTSGQQQQYQQHQYQ